MREISCSRHYIDGEKLRIVLDMGMVCLGRRADKDGGRVRPGVCRTAGPGDSGGLDGDCLAASDHRDDRFHHRRRGDSGLHGVPLTNLRACCEATFPRAGTYTLGGAYSGDAWWAGSSNATSLRVDQFVPGVYMAFFPASPVYGDKVTLGGRVLGRHGSAGAGEGRYAFRKARRRSRRLRWIRTGTREIAVPLTPGRTRFGDV